MSKGEERKDEGKRTRGGEKRDKRKQKRRGKKKGRKRERKRQKKRREREEERETREEMIVGKYKWQLTCLNRRSSKNDGVKSETTQTGLADPEVAKLGWLLEAKGQRW